MKSVVFCSYVNFTLNVSLTDVAVEFESHLITYCVLHFPLATNSSPSVGVAGVTFTSALVGFVILTLFSFAGICPLFVTTVCKITPSPGYDNFIVAVTVNPSSEIVAVP